MKESIENRIKNLKNISLRKDEKIFIHGRITQHMESFPLEAKESVINYLLVRLNIWKQSIESFRILSVKKTKFMITAIISLMLALSGSVSLAAQGSAPGDILYPVKVNVNESVRVAFAITPEAKLALQEKFAENRLDEASKLALKGKLNGEAKEEIEARFKANVKSFTENARNLSLKDESFNPTDLNVRFEANIKAREVMLQNILNQLYASGATSTASSTADFLITVRDAKFKIKEERGEFELKLGGIISFLNASTTATSSPRVATSTKESAEGKLKASENVLASSKVALEKHKDKLSVTTQAEAQAKINEAERNIVDGKAKIEAGDYAGARVNFQTAIKLANDARVLVLSGIVDSRIKIKIDDHKDKKEREDRDDNKKVSTTSDENKHSFDWNDNNGRGDERKEDDNDHRENDNKNVVENKIKIEADDHRENSIKIDLNGRIGL